MKKFFVVLFIVMGMTFVFAGSINAAYDFGGETISIPYWDDLDGGEGAAWLEEVGAMFNVNIELVDAGGEDQFTTSVLAGDSIYDIYVDQRRAVDTMAPKGVLYKLNGLIPEDFWDKLVVPSDSGYANPDNYSIGDTLFAMPRPDKQDGRGNVIYYNKELLAEVGLEDISELYNRDEWTWDKFREYANAANQDTDSDGEIDQWGWHRGAAFRYWLVIANNGSFVKEVDGKLVANIDSPEVVEAYQFYHDLTKVDGAVSAPSRDNFVEGRVLMYCEQMSKTWVAADAGFEWGIVPVPKGPRADKYTFPGKRLDLVVLPATVESDEKAAGLLELATAIYKLADPYEDVQGWRNTRIEDKVSNLTTMQAYDFLTENLFNIDLIMYFRYLGLIEPNPTILIENGEKTAAAALGEAAPQFQSMLDQLQQ